MKKIFLIFACLLTFKAITAAEPESYIPAHSLQIVRVNVNRLVQMPRLMNILKAADEKCRESFLLLDELKKHGIEPTTFFAGDLWSAKIGSDDKAYIILVKTALPEAKFSEFFNAQKEHNKNVDLKVSTLAGKRVYCAKYAESCNAVAAGSTLMAFYPAEDVIAFMPLLDESEVLLNALNQGSGNGLVNAVDRKGLAAMAVKNIKRREKIRSINAKVNIAGSEQQDITAEIVLGCKNAKTAMRKGMEMQFIIPGFAGLLFGNDRKLMEELLGCLQILPVNEKIVIKVILGKSVQDKIAVYFSNTANIPVLNGKHPLPANSVNH